MSYIYEINAIKTIMLKCGKTPDVIDGYMEGSILSLMEDMIKLDMFDDFIIISNCVAKSPLESFRNIIPYFLNKIMLNEQNPQAFYEKQIDNKYIEILKSYMK